MTKKDANWTNVLLSAIAALAVMWVTWQGIDGRVIILFSVFILFAQIFVRVRWRLSVPCPHCHFDPVLYKTDRALVVERVRVKLDELRASGKYLLKSQNPFEHLPKIQRKAESFKGQSLQGKSEKSQILSRHV